MCAYAPLPPTHTTEKLTNSPTVFKPVWKQVSCHQTANISSQNSCSFFFSLSLSFFVSLFLAPPSSSNIYKHVKGGQQWQTYVGRNHLIGYMWWPLKSQKSPVTELTYTACSLPAPANESAHSQRLGRPTKRERWKRNEKATSQK